MRPTEDLEKLVNFFPIFGLKEEQVEKTLLGVQRVTSRIILGHVERMRVPTMR